MNFRLKLCYTQNPTLVCHVATIDFYSFCLLINQSMNNQLHLLKSIFKGLDNKSISYETESPKSMKFNETLIRKFNEKDHKRTEANFATMQQKVILMTKTKSIIINYWKITKNIFCKRNKVNHNNKTGFNNKRIRSLFLCLFCLNIF